MERLTIDEIIKHCERKTKLYEEIGKSIDFETIELTDAIKEYWEHKQVKEYLEELKDYRDKNKMVVRVDVENMDSIKDKIEELSKYAESQYNKAIDDFAEKLKEMANNSSTKYIRLSEKETITTYGVEQIAEKLKAGENNDA